MSIKTPAEGHGDTVPADLHEEMPGGLGKAMPRKADPALAEIAKKVAARHSGEDTGYGITKDADGKLRTTTRPA